jgi:hypothetical protein
MSIYGGPLDKRDLTQWLSEGVLSNDD